MGISHQFSFRFLFYNDKSAFRRSKYIYIKIHLIQYGLCVKRVCDCELPIFSYNDLQNYNFNR